ncbi:MAG TPA: DUF1028 domain-containing protein [Solirubrobacterales bacterium]|nr:DUF1028 domain-containing protein [Solirubrobacterales bacterium]
MTYSIIAFDPDSGECGVAVQSNWFSVGSLVTFAEPGVGAVATQANVDVAYGPRGLALMRGGRSAPEALAELIPADPLERERQVAMIDVHGGVAAHTGADCFAHCGQEVGHHHSAQANLMKTGAVWGAMSEAYLGSSGPLAARLLDALDAGEAAGGDLRGRQSAAILVVPARGEPWDRVVEVRVEDHAEPLVELRRLVTMHEAYAIAREGDGLVAEGDMDGASAKYIEAWELSGEPLELRYWAAFALIHQGSPARGAALLREAIDAHEGWGTLLAMLGESDAPAVAEARRLVGLQPAGDGGVGPT